MLCFLETFVDLVMILLVGFFFSAAAVDVVLFTSPELSTLFMYSRKFSSLISLSVNTNTVPFPSSPAER